MRLAIDKKDTHKTLCDLCVSSAGNVPPASA